MTNPNPDAQTSEGSQAFATLGQFLEADEWYPQQMGTQNDG